MNDNVTPLIAKSTTGYDKLILNVEENYHIYPGTSIPNS
jgi:hypothetical protein